MAYPIPPEDPKRSEEREEEARKLGISVQEMLAERALRRPFEQEQGLEALIENRHSYLEGCRKSEIDDTLDSINRTALELHWLLQVQASPRLQELWRNDLDACFAALRDSKTGI